ncbi:MAG: nucleotidyltransferase domain-containing protein [Promethearchaeota archaeon]
MRKPKDKDFFETKERLIFCVVGYLHPPEAYTAYLKYRSDRRGKWVGNGVRYHRMIREYSAAQVHSSSDWLRQRYPEYLVHCPVRGIEFPLVPRNRVLRYCIPETRLAEVLDNPQDALEVKAGRLVNHIVDSTGVPVSKFGVTGSILLGTHNPRFSDINIVVLGDANARVIRESIDSIYEKELEPYSLREIEIWQQKRAQLLGISDEYKDRIVFPQWFRGRIDGTPFHLHPTRSDDEITMEYGDEYYTALEPVELTATISDDSESLFAPANFGIEDVTLLDGPSKAPRITKIVSYEGIFAGSVGQGNRVRARGILERVKDKKGRILRYQVVIGTFSTKGWIVAL